MDVDFIVQDTYAVIRPQWKITSDFDEAGRLFADAVAENYKSGEQEKAAELEEVEEDESSEENEGEDIAVPEMDDHQLSSEEVDNDVSRDDPLRSAS